VLEPREDGEGEEGDEDGASELSGAEDWEDV